MFSIAGRCQTTWAACRHVALLATLIQPLFAFFRRFSDATEVLDAVPIGENLHRALVHPGVLELQAALLLRRPELLEGESRWESTLRTVGVPMLRLEGEGAMSPWPVACTLEWR